MFSGFGKKDGGAPGGAVGQPGSSSSDAFKEKAGELGGILKNMSVSAAKTGAHYTKEGYIATSQKLEHLKWKATNRQPSIGKTDIEVDMDVLISTAQQVGVKRGWLWKCRHKGHKWSHRYFIQAGSLIVYYEKDTDKNPSGCFLLHSSCVCHMLEDEVGGRRNAFDVETPERTFHLSADTEEEARSWMTAFENCTYAGLASSAANERLMSQQAQQAAMQQAQQAQQAAMQLAQQAQQAQQAPPPAYDSGNPFAAPAPAAAPAGGGDAAEWRALAEGFKALVDPSVLSPEDKAVLYERLVPKYQALKAAGEGGVGAWGAPPPGAGPPAGQMNLLDLM